MAAATTMISQISSFFMACLLSRYGRLTGRQAVSHSTPVPAGAAGDDRSHGFVIRLP